MNYQNGKIYCLRSYQTDDVYIGSTCSPLSKRLCGHKSDYKNYINDKGHYRSSYKIIEYDDYYIELIELFPCISKMELHKREGEIIRQTDNCVNKQIAGRSDKEYCEDNKDKIKKYKEKNKEQIDKKKREWREINKEKIAEQSKIRCEKYMGKNKESIIKKNKEYYANNKDVILERNRDYQCKKYTCEVCNIELRRDSKIKHEKSKKHIENASTEKVNN